MKKVLFALFVNFIVLINVNATIGNYNFDDSVSKINDSFIVDYNKYELYIKTGAIPFRYSNGLLNRSDNLNFTKGGLLNKEEYTASLDSSGGTYLYSPNEFWTMTKSGDKYYSNNADASSSEFPLHNKSEELNIRVTEYVRNDVYVAGKGEYAEPWIFIAAKVTVTYNSQGGTACNGKKVIYGQKYGSVCNSNLTGYRFDGWFTEASGGTKITNDSIVSETTDHTLYAHWTRMDYTVTLNGNGATTNGSNTAVVTAYLSNISAITNPKKEYTITYNSNGTGATLGKTSEVVGYTFNGWFTASSGGLKVIDAAGKLVPNVSGYTDSSSKWIKNGGATLYAQWTSKSTQFTTATKTNALCKWNTSSAGNGTAYALGYAYTPTSNITLYANCISTIYTATLNNNGATTNGSTSANVYLNSSTVSAITKPVKKYIISYNANSSGATISPTSTESTYTFNGWYTATSGGTKVIDSSGNLVANVSGYTNSSRQWIKQGGITLYAQWTPKSVTLASLSKTNAICKWNGNSAGTGDAYNSSASFTPTSNISLYAICVDKVYAYWPGQYTFIAPITGEYKLEVWGASGGKHYTKAGYGGYSYGTIHLDKNTVLYVVAGGMGGSTYGGTYGGAAGTNGGGAGGSGSPYSWGDGATYQGGGGGGGASHIATAPGYLPSLSSNKNAVVIVAGGGGGASQWGNGTCDNVFGNGGGYIGNNGGGYGGYLSTDNPLANSGGTQTSGYSFGQGQYGRSTYSFANCGAEGGGGAGGGYYGGKTYQGTGQFTSRNGSGGSSYIGGNVKGYYLYNKGMICVNCATNSSTALYTRSVSRDAALGWNASTNSSIPRYGEGYARITIME